jgi:hypothetical protein
LQSDITTGVIPLRLSGVTLAEITPWKEAAVKKISIGTVVREELCAAQTSL